MTTRNITKSFITEEDMVLGVGSVTQVRGVSRELSKVSFTKVIASTADLLTLTGVSEVRVQNGDLYKYVTDGAFVANATTIVPTGGDGTEAWIRTFAIDKYVSTLADLRTVYATEGQTIHIKGHTIEGIGGGEFRVISADEAAIKGYTDTDVTPLLVDGKYGERVYRKLYVTYFGAVPKNFGAVPTPSTIVDTTAVQAAVNYASSTQQSVYFDKGGFFFDTITLPTNFRGVLGSGIKDTAVYGFPGKDLFVFDPVANGVNLLSNQNPVFGEMQLFLDETVDNRYTLYKNRVGPDGEKLGNCVMADDIQDIYHTRPYYMTYKNLRADAYSYNNNPLIENGCAFTNLVIFGHKTEGLVRVHRLEYGFIHCVRFPRALTSVTGSVLRVDDFYTAQKLEPDNDGVYQIVKSDDPLEVGDKVALIFELDKYMDINGDFTESTVPRKTCYLHSVTDVGNNDADVEIIDIDGVVDLVSDGGSGLRSAYVGELSSGHSYVTNDLVYHAGAVYKANQSFTSGGFVSDDSNGYLDYYASASIVTPDNDLTDVTVNTSWYKNVTMGGCWIIAAEDYALEQSADSVKHGVEYTRVFKQCISMTNGKIWDLSGSSFFFDRKAIFVHSGGFGGPTVTRTSSEWTGNIYSEGPFSEPVATSITHTNITSNGMKIDGLGGGDPGNDLQNCVVSGRDIDITSPYLGGRLTSIGSGTIKVARGGPKVLLKNVSGAIRVIITAEGNPGPASSNRDNIFFSSNLGFLYDGSEVSRGLAEQQFVLTPKNSRIVGSGSGITIEEDNNTWSGEKFVQSLSTQAQFNLGYYGVEDADKLRWVDNLPVNGFYRIVARARVKSGVTNAFIRMQNIVDGGGVVSLDGPNTTLATDWTLIPATIDARGLTTGEARFVLRTTDNTSAELDFIAVIPPTSVLSSSEFIAGKVTADSHVQKGTDGNMYRLVQPSGAGAATWELDA